MSVGKVVARPLVLLPLGVVALVVSLLTALNAVAAARWGDVVEEGRACGSEASGMCLVRTDVSVDGPRYSRRDAGDDWDLRPSSGRAHEVSLPDRASDRLREADVTQGVMLSQPDGDVVGLEAGGERVATTWNGTYGALQRVGLGLLGAGLGAGLVVVALRMRRAVGWTGHEPVQKHGSVAVALPVLLGFVLWTAPRFIW
ncbi:hypothetical protein ACOCJ5_02040 [Knoellia sp. CPCC 206450]|uniref:hypothetical protein n=1 Tax=Knoellia tibetensis TaxID=3404798 RepID=UPI003B42B710